jgi:hypothetical protein
VILLQKQIVTQPEVLSKWTKLRAELNGN